MDCHPDRVKECTERGGLFPWRRTLVTDWVPVRSGSHGGRLAVRLYRQLAVPQIRYGESENQAKFSEIFSKSRSVNILSAARMFLFGARDVWFVVALPIYLGATFGWDHSAVVHFSLSG